MMFVQNWFDDLKRLCPHGKEVTGSVTLTAE
jgi:hypothetical protein